MSGPPTRPHTEATLPVSMADPGRTVRLLMYSHDSWGLGHLRRSLAIAGAVTKRFRRADVLIVTGSPCATQFELPDRVDVMKLPAISKDARGQYIARRWPGRLTGTLKLRSRLILESYRAFDPHLVIVDHQLTGLYDEALPMLREARDARKILIYGMRDVLDETSRVTEQWSGESKRWALDKVYDLICIYGAPEVFDPRLEYPELQPLRERTVFTGYVVTPAPAARWPAVPSLRRKVLVTMGGGEDGADRVLAYLEALAVSPANWRSEIVCGPLMEPRQTAALRAEIDRKGLGDTVELCRFSNDLQRRMRDADAVVSMAGYNTCAEIMQNRVPAVLLPRTAPRKEQMIRAMQLERLGLARCQTDHSPKALREAVELALGQERPVAATPSLAGLDAMCTLVESRLAGAGARQEFPLDQSNAARAV